MNDGWYISNGAIWFIAILFGIYAGPFVAVACWPIVRRPVLWVAGIFWPPLRALLLWASVIVGGALALGAFFLVWKGLVAMPLNAAVVIGAIIIAGAITSKRR